MLSLREISSRSERLSACSARFLSAGRMPPVGEITEKIDEDFRSNRRPIELIGSPACQRSQIADRWPPSNKCDVAASCPHSIFAKRLECCADQLSPPAVNGHSQERRACHGVRNTSVEKDDPATKSLVTDTSCLVFSRNPSPLG